MTTKTSGAQLKDSMGPARHAAVGSLSLLAAALLLSAAAVPGARAQAETEFSYIPGAKNGPENWGKIKPEWANCSTGQMQSPIDLSDDRAKQVQSLGYLNTSYRPAEASIVNTGHYVMGNTMNARPLQEVNNRGISIFCPKPYDYY